MARHETPDPVPKRVIFPPLRGFLDPTGAAISRPSCSHDQLKSRRGKPESDTHADFEAPKRAAIDADLRDEGWDSSGENKSKIRVPGNKTVRGGLNGVAREIESFVSP